jgi:hypothetical protein
MSATEIGAFLFQRSVAYCKNCGWNVENAKAKLRSQMRGMWVVAGVGVLMASAAWIKGPYGVSGAAMIAAPFILLPLSSGLVTKYRLSQIAGAKTGTHQRLIDQAVQASPILAVADPERDTAVACDLEWFD